MLSLLQKICVTIHFIYFVFIISHLYTTLFILKLYVYFFLNFKENIFQKYMSRVPE